MGCLLLYAGLGQKKRQKMALISGLLLYPGLLYPGSAVCCSIVQCTGIHKMALISGLLLYPGLLYPGSTVSYLVALSTRRNMVPSKSQPSGVYIYIVHHWSSTTELQSQ